MLYRVAVFIDGGYLAKIPRGHQVDLVKFPRHLADHISTGIDILRTYYYFCPPYVSPTPTPDESRRLSNYQRFQNAARRFPRFELREGDLLRYRDERGEYVFIQKKVDVLLSIDLVRLSTKGQITHAAIVAGDADFVPAIQIAKDEGVSIWLFYNIPIHNSLWNAVDERIELTPEFLEPVLRFR